MDGLPGRRLNAIKHVHHDIARDVERTLTLGSAGKTFSVTGWKIGWAIAPAHLARAGVDGAQWIPFTVATPLQEAVATAFETAPKEDYFQWLATTYEASAIS